MSLSTHVGSIKAPRSVLVNTRMAKEPSSQEQKQICPISSSRQQYAPLMCTSNKVCELVICSSFVERYIHQILVQIPSLFGQSQMASTTRSVFKTLRVAWKCGISSLTYRACVRIQIPLFFIFYFQSKFVYHPPTEGHVLCLGVVLIL